MYPQGKKQKEACNISQSLAQDLHILDLPEEILRRVFRYLTDVDLYFNVRDACHQIRRYVDDYIQVGGKFVVTGGRAYTEILTVFKRREKISSVFSAAPPSLQLGKLLEGHDVHFGGILGGKVIIGISHNGDHTDNGVSIYQYKIEKNDFDHLLCRFRLCRLMGLFSDFLTGSDHQPIGCAITEDEFLVMDIKNKVWLLRWFLKSDDDDDDGGGVIRAMPTTPLPEEEWDPKINNQTITRCGKNKVMLVGGDYGVEYWDWDNDADAEASLGRSSNVFEGHLTEDKEDIIWKKLESMKIPRAGHITFKIKDNVYVAGGYEPRVGLIDWYGAPSSCERFSLYENKWFECDFSLPYPLLFPSVAVSADETFALITGGVRPGYGPSKSAIIFREDEGYQLLSTTLSERRLGNALFLL